VRVRGAGASPVLERPIRFQQITTEDYKATMMQYGISDAWAQGLVAIVTAQEPAGPRVNRL